MVKVGWSREATISAINEAIPRAYFVSGQLMDLATETEGAPIRYHYDFRRLSKKGYDVADALRDARAAIAAGGSHLSARLMLGGALRSIEMFETLIAETNKGISVGRQHFRDKLGDPEASE
jgi:hypothetical protein